ncbi:Peptidyl-prolyl cis-trans isomerase PpiB [hydrothermal vent metagenome]|uniref:Thiol:disulfide interchange protein DsbA n=1 Tax=hydrothermal vent metagenome TaxID=652676 RepID=A0A3B0XU12_9ZZZZ
MKFKKIKFSLFTLIALFMFGALSNAQAGKNPEVEFKTSMGTFRMELYPDKAPLSVENFLKYVDDGFYDNTIFHRVVKDFVVQGGGYEPGLKKKETRKAIKSESSNRLKNLRGTVAMARRNHPDTATSQFFINLTHNKELDYKNKYMPRYAVFGKISKGMDVIDKISVVETAQVEKRANVPVEDVMLISAKRVASKTKTVVKKEKAKTKSASASYVEPYVEGEHYIVLDKPVPTRNSSKVEVIEMFSYGCPHCYEFEPSVKGWAKEQSADVDFWFFPAVWNKPMALYARAFYAAHELNVFEKIHMPLFKAIVIENKSIRDEADLADFFNKFGVEKAKFKVVFNSAKVIEQADEAKLRVKNYKPSGVPEIVVNGKYRIDRMHAGGMKEMLEVTEFLVNKERRQLKK